MVTKPGSLRQLTAISRGWTAVRAVGGGGVDDDAAVEVGAEADDVGGLQKIDSRQFRF